MISLSRRMQNAAPNILAQLEEKVRTRKNAGLPVYNLSAGTPDLPPDSHVMEALSKAALDPENYKYAISDFPELLDTAVDWYRERYGVFLERDAVTSVYGTQEGMAHIAFPICNPGDVVLVPDPGYPVFRSGPMLAGAELVTMQLREDNGYIIDLDAIPSTVAHQAKLMVVSYPNNPVTACAPPEFYERLVAFAKKYDILIIHDNAYNELVLDGEPGISFLSLPGSMDVGIEFNSLSKSYNLTGMRMSFALGNPGVIGAFRTLRSQIDYGPFPAVQKAAIAALRGPQDILRRNREEYRFRGDVLTKGLCGIGWDVTAPHSTMFAWYPLPDGHTDDVAFTFRLLELSGVVCVPGSSFGEMGKGYVRFALVLPANDLSEAAEAIAKCGIL